MSRETGDEQEYEAGWGVDKADYYNADVIETEQDALEEEAEARRLQQKHLAGLSEADFGFDALQEDEIDDQQLQASINGSQRTRVTEISPQIQLTSDMSKAERLKLLHSLYPEFEHLRKEYIRLQPVLDDLQASEGQSKSVEIRRMALSSYMACLSMYFTLLVSPASKQGSQPKSSTVNILPPQQVRAHPLMARLVKCRELWSRVEDAAPILAKADERIAQEIQVSDQPMLPSITSELATVNESRKRKRKSRAERAAEAATQEAEAQRQARIRKTQEDLADFSSLITKSSKKSSQPAVVVKPAADDSDFGDEVALTAEEAAEKAGKKKSLRFYTSQIAQKANKRERKGLMAGGDDDIPYRERFRDRQARTMDHPEDRYTRAKPGDNQDDDDDDDDVDNDLTQIKPAKRRRDGDVGDGDEQGGAKRKINYEIEKNKGLTPHRKKEVRNPRVKKRMRYEDKKKRLGSKKAIYKGGEGKGGYGGERTGINANVVKSVRL